MKFGWLFLASFGELDAVRYSRSRSESLLTPISTAKPSEVLYPPRPRAPLDPVYSEVEGVKHTNKFWGNWLVNDGPRDFSIYPSPYTLKMKYWEDRIAGVHIMKGETDYNLGNHFFITHWHPDFVLGMSLSFEPYWAITKESHFGVHVALRGQSCNMTLPIYAGSPFVSGRYTGDCTPKITTDFTWEGMTKLSAGTWTFKRRFGTKVSEYRVYALTADGELVDDSYDFNGLNTGAQLNKPLDGWVRMAHVQSESDGAVLDRYANKIITGWEMDLTATSLTYKFETVGPGDKVLNWVYNNHMHFLGNDVAVESGLTRTRSPVKGLMHALSGGTSWTFNFDPSEAMKQDFLPAAEPAARHLDDIKEQLQEDYLWRVDNWRRDMHKRDHYFSGKGFQKLGTICHMMAKFKGKNHADVQNCAGILKEGFKCMYDRTVSDNSDRGAPWPAQKDSDQLVGCLWSPFGQWYDTSYGGIPSRWDDSPTCGLDFGNSCYNDHHYHYGYFVVSGAMLVDLLPEMAQNTKFVDFVNMFIRDVANPSKEDTYFPQFRSFDFFDMHSWSRGLKPEPSGKDQESTSEEVNFHFGMLLWGRVMGNSKLEKLGAATMTLSAVALKEYFLMRTDNKVHTPEIAKNHVTGIFFQNKMDLKTWFGPELKFVHGIQMLPLTGATLLSRSAEFCQEEWEDRIEQLEVDLVDRWWSILFTGNLALHKPEWAWWYLKQMTPNHMDDGLSKSWALYWTAIQPGL